MASWSNEVYKADNILLTLFRISEKEKTELSKKTIKYFSTWLKEIDPKYQRVYNPVKGIIKENIISVHLLFNETKQPVGSSYGNVCLVAGKNKEKRNVFEIVNFPIVYEPCSDLTPGYYKFKKPGANAQVSFKENTSLDKLETKSLFLDSKPPPSSKFATNVPDFFANTEMYGIPLVDTDEDQDTDTEMQQEVDTPDVSIVAPQPMEIMGGIHTVPTENLTTTITRDDIPGTSAASDIIQVPTTDDQELDNQGQINKRKLGDAEQSVQKYIRVDRPASAPSNDLSFKLNHQSIYRNVLANADTNPALFHGFFSRNFKNTVFPDMNKDAYEDVSSFDVVHILNHGAFMYKTKQRVIKDSIVAAFTACEVLYPEIPTNEWLDAPTSVLMVRKYGSLIFSENGISALPNMRVFLESTLGDDTPGHLLILKTRLVNRHYASLDQIMSKRSMEEISQQNFENDLPLDVVMNLIEGYISFMKRMSLSAWNNKRLSILYAIHMSIAKLGKCSPFQLGKFQNEIKTITNTDVVIEMDSIINVFRYGKKFISENVAHQFFSRLAGFIIEEDAIHFHHLFLYTAYQEMAGMKFILAAKRKFPDFNWTAARSNFPSDWNTFDGIIDEIWARPYMAYTKIEQRYAMKHYKSLAYLCWQLLIKRGGAEDQPARLYQGFNLIPSVVKNQVRNLIRQYETDILVSATSGQAVSLDERKRQFATFESKIQKYAEASALFDIELNKLDPQTDLGAAAAQALLDAEELLPSIMNDKLLPVRPAMQNYRQFREDDRDEETNF